MDLGTDPGTLGGAPFRSHGGNAIRGGHHADSNDRCSTMGRSPLSRASNAPCDDLDGSGSARVVVVPAEIAGVVWVRRLSFRVYLASFATAPGVISHSSCSWFLQPCLLSSRD